MRRTQIYLDPNQQKFLKALAHEKSVSISELIRGAIQEWIQRTQKPTSDPLDGIVGLYYDEKDREGSVRHDDIYE